MDLHQPSGSFKSRGIGNMILKAIAALPIDVPRSSLMIYSSSGGNAGLAAVTAAHALGCPCTVVVPESTTELMIRKIKAAGGRVIQFGESWAEADIYLRELMVSEAESGAEGVVKGVYCPPFDHPDIWQGNSTIVDEIIAQLPNDAGIPAALVASVGGGGLLVGIQHGLERHSMGRIPVLAVETRGADSLAFSLLHPEAPVLPRISSIATSLGARRVAAECQRIVAREGSNIKSVVLEDWQGAQACIRFAEEERCVVEVACGISLAACYFGGVLEKALARKVEKTDTVVVVVCGGSNISLGLLVSFVPFDTSSSLVICIAIHGGCFTNVSGGV